MIHVYIFLFTFYYPCGHHKAYLREESQTENCAVIFIPQLIAEYEEQDRPSIQHNGGDGASASSTGTTSPDIFQTGNSAALPLSEISNATSILGFLQPCQNSTSSNNVITDVVVTSRDLALGELELWGVFFCLFVCHFIL